MKSRKILSFAFAGVIFGLQLAAATILHVPSQYPTIQEGVNAALESDTVMVASGTYNEHVEIGTSLYLLGEDMYTTIIDAQGTEKCIRLVNLSGGYGQISGFTMQNSGTGYSASVANCGLCVLTYGLGDWVVENNIFRDNPRTGLLTSDTGIIRRNIFENNGNEDSGEGLFVTSDADVTIINNDFKDNREGIYAHPAVSHLNIFNNVIIENETGISMGAASYDIGYNDVWDNTTNYSGCSAGTGDISEDPMFLGGVPFNYYLADGSPCIDAGNPASQLDPDNTPADIGVFYYDQGIIGGEVVDQSQPVADYGFWFDSTVIRWQEFFPSFDNMSAVELYISRTGSPGDVIVQIQTPTGTILGEQTVPEAYIPITGWNRINFFPPVDLLPGNSHRIYVFASEPSLSPSDRYSWRGNTSSTYPGENDVSGSWPDYDYAFITYGYDYMGIETGNRTALPDQVWLDRAFPNPFNPSTVIRYRLPMVSFVNLSVYDVSGCKVAELVNGWRDAGVHEVSFEGSELPSGMYVYDLEAGDVSTSRKMILLK